MGGESGQMGWDEEGPRSPKGQSGQDPRGQQSLGWEGLGLGRGCGRCGLDSRWLAGVVGVWQDLGQLPQRGLGIRPCQV